MTASSVAQTDSAPVDPRAAYREALLALMAERPEVFCLDSDTGQFRPEDFGTSADRYLNLGICEQNLLGVAAGLAASGKQPFVSTMAAFASLRALEAVRDDVALNRLPVRIGATHGGLSAGHFGPTHHALEDVAIMRLLPGMTVLVPADAAAVRALVRQAAELPGPVYLRLGREPVHPVAPPPRLGSAQWLREGTDLALLACGPAAVHAAVAAAGQLAAAGVDATVLNLHTIKPLDQPAVLQAAATGLVITVEDHWMLGGLAGAVAELLGRLRPTRVVPVGVPDTFAEFTGGHQELLDHYGVSAEAVVAAALLSLDADADGGNPPRPSTLARR